MIKNVLAVAVLALLIGMLIININDEPDDDESGNVIDVTGDTNVEGAAIVSPGGSGLEIGEQAPSFKLETLSGETVKLSELRGKKVFLNFWATWCPPCKKEMPEMQKFHEAHPDDLVILAVNATGQENSVKTVRKFISEYNYNYPILLDKNLDVLKVYSIITIPTTYFIGTDGVIQQSKKMGPMTQVFMEEMLKKLDQDYKFSITWKYFLKKEWIPISLKRRLSYNELVNENRKEIMQDQSVLEKIESKFELKYQKLQPNKEAQAKGISIYGNAF